MAGPGQRPAPWRLTTLLAVIDRLRAADPRAVFVEAGFPWQRLDFAVPNHGWLHPPLRRDVEPPPFFAGFSPGSGQRSGADPAALARQAAERGASPWLMLEAEQAIGHRAYLGAVGIPLLVTGGPRGDLPELAAEGFAVLPFEEADGTRCGYRAAIPAAMLAGLGADRGEAWTLAPARLPRRIRINPVDLMSDVPWEAEGDDAYSWLWTGPAICHRLCLGHPPVEAREVRIHLIASPQHEGLADNLIVQLDGRRADAELSPTRGGRGTIRVALPEEPTGPVVIGLCAFPDREAPGDDGRLTRIGIEAVEIVT